MRINLCFQIFPLFMKTPKKNKKRLLSADQHEEYVSSIIASLLRNCKGSQKQRLLSKFMENDFEKVDRLMELHLKYLEKVENVDKQIDEEKQLEDLGFEDESDAVYVKRLSGGLFTLQLIDYIILEISVSSSDSAKIKQRLNQILNLRKQSMKTIRNVMRGKWELGFLYLGAVHPYTTSHKIGDFWTFQLFTG